MNLDLSNKHALVCGSSQGIGRATAITLSKMGAKITLLARDEKKLAKVSQELDTKNGQKHNYECVDFNCTKSLKKAINNIIAIKGVDVLINNTGGPPSGPVLSASEKNFEDAFKMHVICNQILTQAIVPEMKKKNFGRIVNVISTSVKIPIPNLGVSNTIRGAVASWAKTMANELGVHGITVNNVLPGFTNTNRLKSLIEQKSIKTGFTQEKVVSTMHQQIPANRFGSANEVANAIAFLCSPAASYINGINLPVDGGRTGSL